MAEAPEHTFLSNKFLEVLQRFSKLELYRYTEAERKKFDFACNLLRDWNRLVVGQTLWKHTEGIDKDIRIMLTDSNADIWAYIVRHNVKNQATIQEVINDYQRTGYGNQLFKLKLFFIPDDFDADSEEARKTVGDAFEEQIINDLLFNVVFERLSAQDIDFLLNDLVSYLTLLQEISANGPTDSNGLKTIARKKSVLSENISYSVWTLYLLGFLHGNHLSGKANEFSVSPKGRVLLDLVNILEEALDKGILNDELSYVLNHLGLSTEVNGKAAFREVDLFSSPQNSRSIFNEPKLTRFLTWVKVVRKELLITFPYMDMDIL